jgi:proliferating cell nuclear antigen
MLEARLTEGAVLKKIMDALKDLVEQANFDCSPTGISLQAMDSSHVSLVSLMLQDEGFDHFRCDRNISLGINMTSMGKILKCAGSDDVVTLKAKDQADQLEFMFESPKQTRISHFSLKLMNIDSEHLGIPDTEYKCIVKMPSAEFKHICNELNIIGDTIKISASKDGVRFGVSGDIGNGNIICKQEAAVDEEEGESSVAIKLEEKVSLTFALRYLNTFAKASSLSSHVILKLSPDVPLVVEYPIKKLGYLRFYLAPKIEEEEGGES